MGANIDYAIVIASRYQELKNTMSHRDAMIETLNFAFPTVITSGTILAVAGTLIGQMTSEAAIVGIGQSLGRGTIISMLFVLFVLPQILLLGGGLADKASISMPTAARTHQSRERVFVVGLVTGEIKRHGQWPCPRRRRRQRQPARHLRTHRGRRAAGKSQIGGGLP